MAPEQHRGELLTAAADQYSFCVALWEALCEAPPFSGSASEMQEAKHSGPPKWPNPRVSRRISEAVVRGLQPTPERRWPSMRALLEALGYDPSRRRGLWLVTLAATLGAVGLGSWVQAGDQPCGGARERLAGVWDAERTAEVEAAFRGVGGVLAQDVWSRTRPGLDEYADDWTRMHTEACEATTVRREQSAHVLDLRMTCLHRAAVDLAATVETLADADAEVVEQAHRLLAELRPLESCADVERLREEVEPPQPAEAEAVEEVRAIFARVRSMRAAGRFEAADAALATARPMVEGVEYGPVLAELRFEEGLLFQERGRYEESEQALNEALRLSAKWKQRELTRRAAQSLMYTVGVQMEQPQEGLRYWPLVDGLSDDQPEAHAQALSARAQILFTQSKFAEAEAEQRAVIQLQTELSGPDDASVALARDRLSRALSRQGKLVEAEAESREALAMRTKSLGARHPVVTTNRNNLAIILDAQGKLAEAEAELRAVIEAYEEVLEADHPDLGMARANLAGSLLRQERRAEAEAEYRAALSIYERSLGADHPQAAVARANLANALAEQDQDVEAEAEFRTALAQFERGSNPDHPALTWTRGALAHFLWDRDRFAEALPLVEQTWAREQQGNVAPRDHGQTAFLLARLLWNVNQDPGDRARARALAEDALRSYREDKGEFEERLAEIQGWLDEHPLP